MSMKNGFDYGVNVDTLSHVEMVAKRKQEIMSGSRIHIAPPVPLQNTQKNEVVGDGKGFPAEVALMALVGAALLMFAIFFLHSHFKSERVKNINIGEKSVRELLRSQYGVEVKSIERMKKGFDSYDDSFVIFKGISGNATMHCKLEINTPYVRGVNSLMCDGKIMTVQK